MGRVLGDLKPERVFYYFEEITKIPHGSKNEKQISDYLYNICKKNNWEVIQDDALNIIIRKPATKGYENSDMVLLQGHMDMVCEADEGTAHDFEKDALKLRIKDGHIYATNTTLGADNGIAVAMILALLESKDVSHPPLEILITVDEEMGMTGVQKLNSNIIKSKHLINLDSEEEGVLTAGCAGGLEIDFSIPIIRKESEIKDTYLIKVGGLQGGHSGADIHKEKGNANKLLGRFLLSVINNIDLVSFDGGSKPNAIPREAKAIIRTKNIELINKEVSEWENIFKNELLYTDSNVNITIEKIDNKTKSLEDRIKEKLLSCINLIPIGVLSKSTVIDLVISSNNLGIVKTSSKEIIINCHPRSSVMSLITYGFKTSMIQLAKTLGINVNVRDEYPGWTYVKDNWVRDICAKVYRKLTNENPKVEAIHAGLECGYLLERCKTLQDAISLGPNMYDVHSPNEHLDIDSVEKTYKYLCEILKEMK